MIQAAAAPIWGLHDKLDSLMSGMKAMTGDNRRPTSFCPHPQMALTLDPDTVTAVMNLRRQAAWKNSQSSLLWRSGTDVIGQIGLETTSPAGNAAVADVAKRMATGKGDVKDLEAVRKLAGTSTTTIMRPTRFEWTSMVITTNGRVLLGGNRISSAKPPVMDPLVAGFVLERTDPADPQSSFQWMPDPDWKQVDSVIKRMPKNTNHASVHGLAVDPTSGDTYVLITSFAKEPNVAKAWKDAAIQPISGVAAAPPQTAENKAIQAFLAKGGAVPSSAAFGANSPIPTSLVVKLNRFGTTLDGSGAEDKQFDNTGLSSMYLNEGLTGASMQLANQRLVILIRRIGAMTDDMDMTLVSTVVLMSANTGKILGTYDLPDGMMGTHVTFSPDGSAAFITGSLAMNVSTLDTDGFVMALQISEPELSTGNIVLTPHTMVFPDGGIVRPFAKYDMSGYASVVHSVLQASQGCFVVDQRTGCEGTDYGDVVVFAVQPGTGEVTPMTQWTPPAQQAFTLMSTSLSADGTQILMGGQLRKTPFWMSSAASFVLVLTLSSGRWAATELPAHVDHMSLITAIAPFVDAGGFLMAGTFMTGEMDHTRQGWVGFSTFS